MNLLALLGLILVMAGCARGPETDQLTFQAFGTLVDLTLHPHGAHDLPRIEREMRGLLDHLHHTWHAWEPGPMTATNQLLRSGEPFLPEPEVLSLIDAGIQYAALSHDRFNPALGELFAAWGFQSSDPQGPPPSAKTITAILDAAPLMSDLQRFADGRILSRNPAVQLDFGGLAKGLALELAIRRLGELGVERAILNAGGDLLTLGVPKDRNWRIGIRDPFGGGVLAGIELGAGEALLSSGSYERGYDWNGERIHHVIDPRTGYPSRGVLGVTVLDTDPVRADALATTLMLAGPENWPQYAARMSARHVIVVLDDGRIETTPAMFDRLDLRVERPLRLRSPGSAGD
jgi:thiamine biosynthesis lipoprotein